MIKKELSNVFISLPVNQLLKKNELTSLISTLLVKMETDTGMMQELQREIEIYDDVRGRLREQVQRIQDANDSIKKTLSLIKRIPRMIRVASWNIKRFQTRGKVSDEIIERVSATIIENEFDVIAIQEVGVYQIEKLKENNCIEKLVDALNNESEEEWKYTISCQNIHQEYGAFVWNTGGAPCLNLKRSYIINLNFTIDQQIEQASNRKYFVGEFQVGKWTFSLVSIHLVKDIIDQECCMLPLVITIAKIMQEQDVVLLGDFNCILPARVLGKVGYESLFHNTAQSECFDDILIHSDLRIISYVQHKMAHIKGPKSRRLLEDIAIVSDHFPIYADFY